MRKLGVVALVVVGLLSFGQAILMFSSISNVFSAQVVSGSAFQISIITTVVAILTSIGLGSALILSRRKLAARLFDEDDAIIPIDGQTFMRVGIVSLGLSLLVHAIPGLIVGVSTALIQRQFDGEAFGGNILWLLVTTGILSGVLRLIMATALLAASAPLSRWLTRPVQRPVLVPSQVTLCPACGAAYSPEDYREGVERKCVECHSRLDGGDV